MSDIVLLEELMDSLADGLCWIRDHIVAIFFAMLLLVAIVMFVIQANSEERQCKARGGVPINSRSDGIVCTKGRLGE